MRTTLPVIVGTTLALLASVSHAEEPGQRKVKLAIEQQPLEDALNQWAQQTGFQLVWPSSAATNRIVAPITGTLSAGAALDQLLSDTPLTYIWVNERAVAVKEKAKSVPPAQQKTEVAQNKPLRIAQLDAAEDAAGSPNMSAQVSREQDAAAQGPVQRDKSSNLERQGIPEILVEGSRISNTDIQRTEDDTQPYVVFDHEQIERTNAVNVENLLKTRLPMNSVQATFNQSDTTSGSSSSINLRGLGEGQTLILVNGRRMPSVNRGGIFGQPDINGIPLHSIERIEVLPSTASGIYGGGATGGVVNIITRRSTGLEISADYGNTFEADAATHHIDGSFGLDLEDGRTYVQIVASHAGSDALMSGDRDLAKRAIALQAANNPGELSASGPPFGRTSNICAAPEGFCGADPLVLDNGTSLGASTTSVPAGYAGPGSDGGAALLQNAGRYNLDLPDTGFGNRASLLSDTTVRSLALNLRRTFTPSIEAFLDSAWYENESRRPYSANGPFITFLDADAPNNPFNTPILVNFPAVGLGDDEVTESTSETVSTSGGVIVRLPRGWTAAADYGWSRARSKLAYSDLLVGDPNGDSVDVALTDGTLDVMRDTNAFPLDFSPFRLPSPGVRTEADTTLNDAALRLSGPIVSLPGGALTLSSQLAWREEEAEDEYQYRIDGSGVASVNYRPHASQTVDSYYLEARAPLFSAENALRFVHDLELQASVRHDAYSTDVPVPRESVLPTRESPKPAVTRNSNDVDATKFTVGLRYAPIEDVTLRASYGTGFLPPSLLQIGAATVRTNRISLVDPKRGGTSSVVTYSDRSGGNPNLDPEESKSWSFGAIFTPRFLSGLRLSVDYTRIEKTGEIKSLRPGEVLSVEDLLPGRVTRAALTPADAERGFAAGAITAIDRTFVNVADSRIEAYDFQLDYTLPTLAAGEFHWYAIATYQPDYQRRLVPTTPSLETAGYSGGPLYWRGNAGLTWSRNALTLGWSAQYYDSYYIYTATADPIAAQSLIDYYTLNQGSTTVSSQTYHDVFARYDFGGSGSGFGNMLSNLQVTLGIQNVLDEKPPTLAATVPFGVYSTYGDPRLRRYSLTLRKSF